MLKSQLPRSPRPAGLALIVGVSGGPDSVALLHLLKSAQPENRFRLVVAHVNHRLRGKASDRDQQFVKRLSKMWRIPFRLKRANVSAIAKKNRLNLEEAGRMVRLQFFRALKKRLKADFIVLGHHKDDQSETLLFNMVRGAGPRGMKGMRMIENDVLRPLLAFEKQELTAYCRKHRLSYRIDRTNTDTSFTRNFLRLRVMPLLKKLNPNVATALDRFRNSLEETVNFLDEQTDEQFRTLCTSRNKNRISCERKKIAALPPLLQKMLFQKMFRELQGPMLEQTHLNELLSLINKSQTGKYRCYGRLCCRLEKNAVVAEKISSFKAKPKP